MGLLSMSVIMFDRILSRLIIVSDSICRAIQDTFYVKYISFSDNIPFCVTVMNDNEERDRRLMIEHNIIQRRILSRQFL